MNTIATRKNWSNSERGMTFFVVAAALFVLLGMSALAIDLTSLYVARSEAQKAADSSALAAAKGIVESNYPLAATQAQAETWARDEAIAAGNQNLVGDQAAAITSTDVTFDWSFPNNPRVTVVVQRTAATANAMPTFFAKALGILEFDISATATAEAYQPGPGDPPVCVGCIKPWILPNCDPFFDDDLDCADLGDRFIDGVGDVINPGKDSDGNGGVVGRYIAIKKGDPNLNNAPAAPGQFYPLDIPAGPTPSICPDCLESGGGGGGGGGSLYNENIKCCNTNQFVCGDTVALDLKPGNMVGPTGSAVRCLIHQDSQSDTGQDILNPVTMEITGGSLNPLVAARGFTPITSSTSIVTLPLYDALPLCPGGSCGGTVTIIGFMKLFIIEADAANQNTVNGYIMSISGCASGGGGGSGVNCGISGSGAIGGGGGSGGVGAVVPVRLIRN